MLSIDILDHSSMSQNQRHQHIVATMEHEDDPLLSEENDEEAGEDISPIYHTGQRKHGHVNIKTTFRHLTDYLRSWKRISPFASTLITKESPTDLHMRLIHNRENDEETDGLQDQCCADKVLPIRGKRRYWKKWFLRLLCLFIGFPVVLLVVIFAFYAITFRPPPTLSIVNSNDLPATVNLTHLSPSTSMSPVRLLTFNIFLRPPGVNNNGNDFKDERLQYIISDVLPHYDIIAFQEAFAFGNHRIDRLIRAAQQLGFGYIMLPRHGPWEMAADGGLLLLSRYHILQADILEYPRGLHSDWLSYKGALHALIELHNNNNGSSNKSTSGDSYNGTTNAVHVFTTHTQASYGKGGARTQQDILMRLQQFARLHQFIYDTAVRNEQNQKNSSAIEIPIIAMGDFNIDSADHSSGSIVTPSVNSSKAYTMMMNVLEGKGINSAYFYNDTQGATPSSSLWFKHDWYLPLTDMLYSTFGYHPITFGDYILDNESGTISPAETVLTHPQQLLTAQSIDQLLWSPSPRSHLTLSNITVEKFLVSNQTFTQLSDHYGISSILSFSSSKIV